MRRVLPAFRVTNRIRLEQRIRDELALQLHPLHLTSGAAWRDNPGAGRLQESIVGRDPLRGASAPFTAPPAPNLIDSRAAASASPPHDEVYIAPWLIVPGPITADSFFEFSASASRL